MLFSSVWLSSLMLFLVFTFYFFRISVLKNIQVLGLIPVLLAQCLYALPHIFNLVISLSTLLEFSNGAQPLLNSHIINSSFFFSLLLDYFPYHHFCLPVFFFFSIFILDKCLHFI